jgi:hypothetical protein
MRGKIRWSRQLSEAMFLEVMRAFSFEMDDMEEGERGLASIRSSKESKE